MCDLAIDSGETGHRGVVSKRRISEKIGKNYPFVLKGEIPSFLVNQEALRRWRERFGKGA